MSLHRKLNERERMAYASVARLERERDDLRAQLAERDARLGAIAGWTNETRAAVLEAFQDELNESASYAWYDAAIADLIKLVEALSASAEPSAPKCCTPTDEEEALLASGDYRPEELWGGGRPTCPKCIKSEPSAPVERDELTRMVDAAMVEMSNIHPPLGRGECARLIRAALERKP